MHLCPHCDGALELTHEPDEFPEYNCPRQVQCEHAGCLHDSCGDDRPRECDMCGFAFCPKHLHKLADVEVCLDCEERL